MAEPVIAGVVLAAGSAKRFGSGKLLHEVRGRPLFDYCLVNCIKSTLPRIFVVVPSGGDVEVAVSRRFGTEERIETVGNDEPDRGLMSSLKAGLLRVGDEFDGAMILLADMPFITPEIIHRLLRSFDESGGIVLPECEGPRHPRIIPKRFFHNFLQLDDGERGSNLIDQLSESVVSVSFPDARHFIDIDRSEDIQKAVLWDAVS